MSHGNGGVRVVGYPCRADKAMGNTEMIVVFQMVAERITGFERGRTIAQRQTAAPIAVFLMNQFKILVKNKTVNGTAENSNATNSPTSTTTNRQIMANQLRANSYIDRKSSCD